MPQILNAARKAHHDSLSAIPFAEWLEKQKQAGLFWGA